MSTAGLSQAPSPTTARAALLVAAVAASTTVMHNLTYYGIVSRDNAYLKRSQECSVLSAETSAVGDFAARQAACMAPYDRAIAGWILVTGVLLILTAAGLYAVYPRWRLWRDDARPLAGPKQPALDRELHQLVARAGLPVSPEFLGSPIPAADAIAFGRAGRYRIRLNFGLRELLSQDPGRFRAVVLHELAHVRHRDAHTHYLVKALWWAFAITAVLPVPLSLLTTDRQSGYAWLWRLAALTFLVHIVRTSLIRVREYEADRTARDWLGGPDDLIRALPTADRPGATAPQRWRTRLRRRFGMHPAPERRIARLLDPDAAWQLGFWESVAAGVTASLAVEGLHDWLLLAFGSAGPDLLRWVASLAPALFLSALVAAGAWREVGLTAPRAGHHWSTTVRIGAGLTAGLLGGYRMAPSSIGADVGGWGDAGSPLAWAVLAAVLLVVVTAAVAWISLGARIWQSGGAPWRTWKPGALALAVPLTVILTFWPLLADFGADLSEPLDRLARDGYELASGAMPAGPFWFYVLFEHPMVTRLALWGPALAAVVMLWLFPLSAPRAGRQILGDRMVLVIPLVAGVLFAGGSVEARLLLRAHVAEETRTTDGFLWAFGYWSLVAAVLLAAVASLPILIGFRRKGAPAHFAVPAALFSGGAAALLNAIALIVVNSGFRCADGLTAGSGCAAGVEARWVFDTTMTILVLGTLATCAMVLAAAPLVRWNRPVAVRGTPPRPARILVSRTVLGAGLCIALYGMAGAPAPGYANDATDGPAQASDQDFARKACELQAALFTVSQDNTPAETNANLLDSLRLATDSGDAELIRAIGDLTTAGMENDAAAFGAAIQRIRSACAAHDVAIP